MSSRVGDAAAVFVGIDVAKHELVVAERPSGRTWSVPNEPAALTDLATELHQRAPTRVVLEATGGYERGVVAALHAAAVPVVVANPRQVRQFARSVGRLAKTDALDAAVLAQFAEAVPLPVRAPLDAATQELEGWVERRRQLVQQLGAERLRLASAHPSVRPRVARHIEWLEEELAAVEAKIAELLAQSSDLAEKAALLDSVPGIGAITAAMLVAQVPELGRIEPKALAALIGVAPLNRDSGKLRGKRSTWGGRADVRTALYMPTRTACRHNPVIRAFYQRLIAAGKQPLVALIACMRKLLTICNAIVASTKPWDPDFRPATS
jgi:transposase